MSQQQYTFKNNNGSGLGSSSNLGNASSRDNLKNLMKKQQLNLNYCDNQYIQETMNRTGFNSSSSNNNPQSPQNNSSYQNAYISGGQNYQPLKNQGNTSQQQTSNINKMIEAYQKNRPVTSQQSHQPYQQQQPLHHQNTYSSPLRNNYNNTSINQNLNSPSQRAVTAQDSRRESNNYNNQINLDQIERKSSLGRNKVESSLDNLNSSFGKIVSSSNNYSSQQKNPATSTNKVQQMLKDLMGNTSTGEKTSQYQLQSNYSKSNLNKTEQISSLNSMQQNQINYSNRNEVSHLRSRESSNDKNKFSNLSNNNVAQNNLYNNLVTSSNQLGNRQQNQGSYQNQMARQNSPSQNIQNQINSSFNQGNAYKNMASIEISNFNSSNNINDSYSQKLLKSSNSSKNLQMIDLDSKNVNKSTQNLPYKSKTQQAQQQNNQATLNRNGSNSKLRLQDDIIEQTYKNNRSITPKYTTQNQISSKTQTSNQSQQRNKTPIGSSVNNNNLTSQKSLNDNSYLQIVGTSQPLCNNNNSSFSNVNNTSFNQTNIASSSNLKQAAAQQNDLQNDLQKRRLTPTPMNQNLELFERHQSLQNIIQMQEQQQFLNSQQQSQNKSPLRTNNYISQQSLNNNIQQNSAKENISSISNHQGKNLASTVNTNSSCSSNNYQNSGQREASKSPNHTSNHFSQHYNQQNIPSSQLQSSKQIQQPQQFTQSLRGISQETKNSNQQLLNLQQKQNNLQKTKQANTPINNNGNISGGVSQSSTSSASSQQKSTDLNKSSNSLLNQKQSSQQQQQLLQQQQSQKNIQSQQNQQQNSSSNSPFFGNQQQNKNNDHQNLKKINTQNQNELLKAIQEQIKLKHDRQQGQPGQPKKQRNKLSQDFLDSTYFQFNSQLMEQIQQEQTEEQKNTVQQGVSKEYTNLLNNSLYLTQIKQSQQASQNNFPSFGQLQTSYEMQLQQAQLMADNQQLQQQSQNKSKLNPPLNSQQNQQNSQATKQQQILPQQTQNEQLKQPKLQQNVQIDDLMQKQKQQNIADDKNQLLNQQTVKKSQQLSINEKSSLALNNDQESVDSANTTTCFSEELSKSTLAKINLTELLQIEQNLFDLQKDAFKSKKQTTKFCKNYLNCIAEQNIDNLERIGSDSKQSQILNRMFILERICVMLSLHESLNTASNQESINECNDDNDEDDDCTNHIKNTLQYVHLNFFVFLDTVFNKYNFTGNTKELEQQIKKVFETRTKVKRFQNCLNKQDKFQVISNYCDIILPYLKNFVQNYDKEPYTSIANILNNISIQTVSGTMSILMDCFQKIISDLEEKAAKESKSSIEDSFSDVSSKQNVSTEKSKNTSINSTSEKQKAIEESSQKKKQQAEQQQNSQQESSTAKQNSSQQDNSKKQQQKDYYTQLDEDQDDDEDEEEFSEDRLIGTIPAPYLPPIDNPNKHTLVLDLDETLVHFQEIPDEGGQFLIRPHAEIFLQKLSEYYEIVIFTAAIKDYADFILDVIDTTKAISHRLYRQHTDRNGRCYVKDISKLGRDLSKTLIIDNLPENFCRQPMNGILIQSWYGDSDDRALYDLIPLLIDVTQSKKYRDVRIALQKLREQTMKNLLNGISDPHLNIILDKID